MPALGKINKMNPDELKMLKRRTDLAAALVIALVIILVLRLWFLQIQNGGEYLERSERNRVRVQQLVAPRGNLLDRHGEVLVTNRPRFNVIWLRDDAPHPEEVVKKLAPILEMDISDILDQIRAGADQPRFIPTRLKEGVDWGTVVQIENNAFSLPGVRIEVQPSRDYLYGNLASHLVGYLGEINSKELASLKGEGYLAGDPIGKMGLEKIYEKELRGEKGRSFVEVDVRGFAQKQLKMQEPTSGNDLMLTLDLAMQQAAEEGLQGQAGAVVAMEVHSGRLLALASAPRLPLDKFIGGIPSRVWRQLLGDVRSPLLNKPVQGQYAPGSTYKIITAIAALEEGVVTPETTHYCGGSIYFGGRRYHCWKRGGHGHTNLKSALTESCDVYFYQVGQGLGVDTIARYARMLGLGRKTGVELEHEKEGLIPTAAWKKERYGESWQDGETMSIAIGQGFNLVTPLQLTRMMAAVANGGRIYRPLLVSGILDLEGKLIKEFLPTLDQDVTAIRNSTWQLVREGLESAVMGRRGTGKASRLGNITVAGKTGTSQVVRLSHVEDLEGDGIPYKYRDHAWFTAYAPADAPEIVVTVLVEHGGGGGSVAAPVAREVFAAYFRQQGRLEE